MFKASVSLDSISDPGEGNGGALTEYTRQVIQALTVPAVLDLCSGMGTAAEILQGVNLHLLVMHWVEQRECAVPSGRTLVPLVNELYNRLKVGIDVQ